MKFEYILEQGKFRSRGELRFSEWCDKWKIKWVYEPECFKISSGLYVPDFYLSLGKIFVEVKPLIFIDECYKIKELFEILPVGYGYWIVDENNKVIDCGKPTLDGGELWNGVDGNGWNKCKACGRVFSSVCNTWSCHHFGQYDVDNGFLPAGAY